MIGQGLLIIPLCKEEQKAENDFRITRTFFPLRFLNGMNYFFQINFMLRTPFFFFLLGVEHFWYIFLRLILVLIVVCKFSPVFDFKYKKNAFVILWLDA